MQLAPSDCLESMEMSLCDGRTRTRAQPPCLLARRLGRRWEQARKAEAEAEAEWAEWAEWAERATKAARIAVVGRARRARRVAQRKLRHRHWPP